MKLSSPNNHGLVEKEDVVSSVPAGLQLVVAGVAWFYNAGILTIVFSVGFGAVLTLLVDSRVQKRTWKRESAIRKIEMVYGPLYHEIGRIVDGLKGDGFAFHALPAPGVWESIKESISLVPDRSSNSNKHCGVLFAVR